MILTIGIPVYNSENYIRRCLDSIILSEGFKDFEVVCLDDGSTDRSLEILNDYGAKYSNIRIITSKNRGAYLARSKIIDEAQGEWIGFVDADDAIDSHMYNKMLQVAEYYNNIDMVVCAFNKIVSKGSKIIQMSSYGKKTFDFEHVPEDRGILVGVNPAYWNKIIRRESMKNRLKLDYSPRIMEDYLFMASVLPSLRGVSFIDEPLYDYYDVSASATKKIGMQEVNDAKNGLSELLKQLQDTDVYKNDIYQKNLLSAMVCIHLGIAFTINWNQSSNIKNVWKDTIDFLDEKFPGWRRNDFLSIRYAIRTKTMRKLYVVTKLYKSVAWPSFVKAYHMNCKLIGTDLKW